MKPIMEVKKRYKMYKKGKHWVRAAILFAGAMGVMSVTTQAYADELPNPSGTETVITTPETPPAGAETVRETPKDATSQPTKIEEVAPSEVTTENPSVVENNTTVSEETPVEAQPIVRAEQPAEPIGTPTEPANPTASGNQATTITKEFPTPELDKAVAEAQKDPHITVVKEANQDLGTVTTDQLAQKEAEIAEKQRTQAQEITQKVADVKRQNAEIEKFNADVAKKNQAEKDRYNREKEEYNKHKNDKGYVNEPISKSLVFDQSILTKDTKIASITGGKFINASDFNKVKQGEGSDIFSKLRRDLATLPAGNFQNSKVTATELGSTGGALILEIRTNCSL